MECSDKWLREQIKQVIKNSQPIENNYDVRQLANNILALLDEREGELRKNLDIYRKSLNPIAGYLEDLVKEVLGLDE